MFTRKKPKSKRRQSTPLWRRVDFGSWVRMKWVIVSIILLGLFFLCKNLPLQAWAKNFWCQYGFASTHIYVVGRDELPREALTKVLEPYQHQSIFHFDEAALAADIKNLDWIENLTIQRYLPDIIVITLEEGKPLALWQHDQKHLLIDQRGRVIETQHIEKFGHLPVLVGETAPKHAFGFFESTAAYADIKDKISAAIRVGDRRWDVHLKNGIIIKLPENNLTAAWDRIAALEEEHKILHRAIKVIDLRLPDRLILEMKDGEENASPTSSTPAKAPEKKTF